MTLCEEAPLMRRLMAVLKALADENRVRALMALRPGELCVCQITELLGLAPSTVSKHLTILKQAGLVESRKQERWIFYRLAETDAPAEARKLTAAVGKAYDQTPQTAADANRLKQVLKIDPDELCRRQNRC
jgi:ArsR family transcriptional regulator, arsenate/arsenite/antimonite-responsive transcriptional repressor